MITGRCVSDYSESMDILRRYFNSYFSKLDRRSKYSTSDLDPTRMTQLTRHPCSRRLSYVCANARTFARYVRLYREGCVHSFCGGQIDVDMDMENSATDVSNEWTVMAVEPQHKKKCV
ncbi:hypothetical protein EVAR_86597_1 [Eumeta japonica]|uniref:Uncharacterized protein n=1 Tax=Eumeta variegata TaxID=151549 RepID=A0A4C1W2K6_EUMVA|nr:hypothetical protein EVAR_86597_1 [Eumeta japonica]